MERIIIFRHFRDYNQLVVVNSTKTSISNWQKIIPLFVERTQYHQAINAFKYKLELLQLTDAE